MTFAYLIPLNFLGQLFAGTLLGERTRRRALPVLAAPLRPWESLLGRSLPYVGLGAVLVVGVTWLLGAGWLGLVASVSVVALGLAGSLLIGIASRSQRDMTFLLVGFTTGLSTFLFLPAMFPSVPPVAFLSPMTVVAAGIRGETVAVAALLYAVAPALLAAVALTGLGLALWREEALFSPRTLSEKVVDGVAWATRRRRGLLLHGMAAVPFAVALELFVVGIAIILRLEAAVVLFLVGTALVEETLKGLPMLRSSRRHPVIQGLLVGGGFFLAEKGVLVAALAGFDLLPLGPETLASFGIGPLGLLVIAPLMLHVGTATLNAWLARRGQRGLGWAAAVAVHAIYNSLLVLGGGAL